MTQQSELWHLTALDFDGGIKNASEGQSRFALLK